MSLHPVIEAPEMGKSADPTWWLSSGAYFYRFAPDVGKTVQGDLPAGDPWREHYARSNPRDTANGRRPQCLFRLVRKEKFLQPVVSFRFAIRWVNQIDSPERGEWSGVLAFLRYQDSQNLYYAGIRHDGTLVVKRKRAGKYVTLAQKRVYPGTYDRTTNPNLIPKGWHTLRADALDRTILVSIDQEPMLAVDDLAPEAILETGHTGIRCDFSDVEFESLSFRWYEPPPPPPPKTIEERVADLEARVMALEKGS